MPFLTEKKTLSKEPAANWNSVEYYMPAHQENLDEQGSEVFGEGSGSIRGSFKGRASQRGSLISQSIRASVGKIGALSEFFLHSERPTDIHSIHDLEVNEVSCFLFVCSGGTHVDVSNSLASICSV